MTSGQQLLSCKNLKANQNSICNNPPNTNIMAAHRAPYLGPRRPVRAEHAVQAVGCRRAAGIRAVAKVRQIGEEARARAAEGVCRPGASTAAAQVCGRGCHPGAVGCHDTVGYGCPLGGGAGGSAAEREPATGPLWDGQTGIWRGLRHNSRNGKCCVSGTAVKRVCSCRGTTSVYVVRY